MRIVLLVCFSFFCSISVALTPIQMQALQNLLEPIGEHVQYRWTTKEKADTLIKTAQLSDELSKIYSKDFGYLAGAGLYTAADPISSSDHGSILVQVNVDPRVRFLDVDKHDKEIRNILNPYGLRHIPFNLKYKSASGAIWFVLKENGGVTFSAPDYNYIEANHAAALAETSGNDLEAVEKLLGQFQVRTCRSCQCMHLFL